MLLGLIGFQTNTNEIAAGGNEVFLREQTVLRGSVTRSENTRNSTTGRRCSHEENRSIRTLGLCKRGIPSGIPHNPSITHSLGRSGQITRARTSLGKHEATTGEKKEKHFFHNTMNTPALPKLRENAANSSQSSGHHSAEAQLLFHSPTLK